ncbi:MAG: cell envelope biogenesis protein TolA [Sphingobium sp.]
MERAEKIGLGVATAGHVLLFGLLSAGLLSAPDPLKLNSPPMDVSLVDEAALKSMAPKISTEPPPPSVAPEKGPTEDAAPAPEAAPLVVPDPAPAPPKPKPAPPKKDVPKAAPKPKSAPEKPAAKPTPKPEKPKVAAAIPAKPAAKPKPNAPARASGAGKADKPRGSMLGNDFLKGIQAESDAPRKPAVATPAATMGPQQKAALDRLISDQIYPHLRLPSGADVELLVAFLDVKLDREGNVIGRPAVLDVTGTNPSNNAQVSLYKERAVQAVMQASPFRGLPVEFYEQWKWLSPLRIYARKAR